MAALVGLTGRGFGSLLRDPAADLVLIQRREHPNEFDGFGYFRTRFCLRRRFIVVEILRTVL